MQHYSSSAQLPVADGSVQHVCALHAVDSDASKYCLHDRLPSITCHRLGQVMCFKVPGTLSFPVHSVQYGCSLLLLPECDAHVHGVGGTSINAASRVFADRLLTRAAWCRCGGRLDYK